MRTKQEEAYEVEFVAPDPDWLRGDQESVDYRCERNALVDTLGLAGWDGDIAVVPRYRRGIGPEDNADALEAHPLVASYRLVALDDSREF